MINQQYKSSKNDYFSYLSDIYQGSVAPVSQWSDDKAR